MANGIGIAIALAALLTAVALGMNYFNFSSADNVLGVILAVVAIGSIAVLVVRGPPKPRPRTPDDHWTRPSDDI